MPSTEGFSGVPETLRPQLEHNRIEWYTLQRRKRQAVFAGFLVILPSVVFVPARLMAGVTVGVLALMFAAFVYFDIRRVLVFRRDVRERAGQASHVAVSDGK